MGDAQHIDIITRALKSLENRASTINSAHMWFHAVSNIKYYLVAGTLSVKKTNFPAC